MPSASRPGDVRAAGAVVLRKGRVLLVHRPAYDDWSFPKGKLDRGETATAAAVREVEEETGLRVRLGVPLSRQSYPNGARTKVVDYWVGRVVGDHDVSAYLVNAEIDEVAWVKVEQGGRAAHLQARPAHPGRGSPHRRATRALVVLRHGQARARKSWRRDDRLRPLMVLGKTQARGVVPVLEAYAVSRIVVVVEHALRRHRPPVRRAQRLAAVLHGRTCRRRTRRTPTCSPSSTTSSTPARTPCCAPIGPCSRSVYDALGIAARAPRHG